MNAKTKKLTMMAMLVAISYVIVALIHFPIFPAAPFLSYEPKDVIIAIGGFIFGPAAAVTISVVVAMLEFLTYSATGIWGMLMNIVSSVSFAAVAALIYKRKHNMKGAVMGLITGIVTVTAMMLLWNYFVTPIYMGMPREAVAAMLIPTFLPFNLLKATLNTAWTLLLYKPVVTALRKTGLLPKPENGGSGKGKISVGLMVAAGLVLVSCILLILVLNGVIG